MQSQDNDERVFPVGNDAETVCLLMRLICTQYARTQGLLILQVARIARKRRHRFYHVQGLPGCLLPRTLALIREYASSRLFMPAADVACNLFVMKSVTACKATRVHTLSSSGDSHLGSPCETLASSLTGSTGTARLYPTVT